MIDPPRVCEDILMDLFTFYNSESDNDEQLDYTNLSTEYPSLTESNLRSIYHWGTP